MNCYLGKTMNLRKLSYLHILLIYNFLMSLHLQYLTIAWLICRKDLHKTLQVQIQIIKVESEFLNKLLNFSNRFIGQPFANASWLPSGCCTSILYKILSI